VELSCTSFSFPLLTFERALQAISLLDIPRYDVGAHEGASHIQPSEVEANPQRVAQRIHHAAGAAGLHPSDFFPTFGKGFRDRPVNAVEPEVRQANLARFRAIVICARTIGARGVTLLPGVVWEELGPERSFDLAVEALKELVAVAHDASLRLSVEAHLESVAESPALAGRLCDEVPGLKLTLDYSHFVAGGHPVEDVHPLVRHAGHFHARQAAPGRLQAGERDGVLDFGDIVGRLAEAGYDRDLCVEYTWQEWRDCFSQDVVSESVLLRDRLRRAIAGQRPARTGGRPLGLD
jgi:sugar phosphate isomerase/epimerase